MAIPLNRGGFMERVEVVGGNVFVLRTRQLCPDYWCCDLYERVETDNGVEAFLLEDFGESEIEAIAMALSDAHETNHVQHHHH
jgi:hypothetical protein